MVLFYLLPFLIYYVRVIWYCYIYQSPYFVCLSITTMSGLRVCICLSVLISKSHSSLPWPCCSLLLGWGCGARCYCRLDLVVLTYAVVDCCCYVVMSCLAQASCYLGARTHYVGYCLILLSAHPAFWIICRVEYLRFVTFGVQCLILCCCYECFCFYLESCAFSHPSVGVLHWCDLRNLPFVLSI